METRTQKRNGRTGHEMGPLDHSLQCNDPSEQGSRRERENTFSLMQGGKKGGSGLFTKMKVESDKHWKEKFYSSPFVARTSKIKQFVSDILSGECVNKQSAIFEVSLAYTNESAIFEPLALCIMALSVRFHKARIRALKRYDAALSVQTLANVKYINMWFIST